jgi:ribonuclease D
MRVIYLITRDVELSALAMRLARESVIAVDVESNSLHVYRPRLCALGVAWREGNEIAVAVVDSLELKLTPMATILGATGPTKLLHDLTFDARLLQASGITLGKVRDTSVAARFLGESSTGLAPLVKKYCGVELNKRWQDHDWAERPFTTPQLDYLAGDVRHLHALDRKLSQVASELGIAPEIDLECRYKLERALEPPAAPRPAYVRIRGGAGLDASHRAVLHRLAMCREEIAESRDMPLFAVASNRVLLGLAQRAPTNMSEVRRLAPGPAREHVHEWLAAIRTGLADPCPSNDNPDSTPNRPSRELKRRLEHALTRWRTREAQIRGVDPQVIVPGHCVAQVVAAMADHEPHDALVAQLKQVEGLCAGRVERYATSFHEIARSCVSAPPATPRVS